MFNILLFLIISIMYIFFYKQTKKTKNIVFLRTCFILLTFLVIFRSFSIGNDTEKYIEVFKSAAEKKWYLLFVTKLEKGYVFINILLSYLTNNARVFLIILGIIFNYSIYEFIKKNSSNYYLSIITYLFFLYYYTSMTAFRQFFAISILLYALNFLKEKQLLKYILAVFIAFLFHKTAIIALLIYPLYYMKYNNKRSLILIITSVLIVLTIEPLLKYITDLGIIKYEYKVRETGLSIANILYSLVYFALYIYAVICKNNNNTEKYDFTIYILLLSFCINLIGIRMNIIHRLSDYFSIYTIILLPNLIEEMKKKEIKRIVIGIYIIFLVGYSSVISFLKPEWNTAYNYRICSIKKDCFK